MTPIVLEPGRRQGVVIAPPSKSHAQRLLIANFLAEWQRTDGKPCRLPVDAADDSDDIIATKRCLRSLASPTSAPILDCDESGATLRFLSPVAAALGKRPEWIRRGRLSERPFQPYLQLKSGLHELDGAISSQFATGLLFALPLIDGDSQIRFKTPLESRGYVDMTLEVLRRAGVEIVARENGFDIAGGQFYQPQTTAVEGDWSGAAFWLTMNALGSDIEVRGLKSDSLQPDRAIVRLLEESRRPSSSARELDVSGFPDLFPALAIWAASRTSPLTFTGIRRLRMKESDRVSAMQDVLTRLGAITEVSESAFTVVAGCERFKGGAFTAHGDHRVAMAIATAVTRADFPVTIDDIDCIAKSYPEFISLFCGSGLR